MIRFVVIAALLPLTGCMVTQQPTAESPAAREARLDRVAAQMRRMCINSGHRPDTAEFMECYARLAALYTSGPNAVPR